ncbi:MAG: LytTR family DNA-binding domain-containing protein [Gemmatimonadota bacterium]
MQVHKIRVLIVDDEPLARERLRGLLAAERDVEVAGECADGDEAVAAIRECAPDLVFLDVQMPGTGGFEVIRAVGPERMPFVVFATAYDAFALRAFEVNALDYLLKPFDEERVRGALERARRSIASGGPVLDPGVLALLRGLRAPDAFAERLTVRTGTRYAVVSVAELDWIQAEDNYVRLHVGGASHLMRETMAAIERTLDPRRFVRVHRSTIVNVDRVRSIESWGLGEFLLVLRDGTKLQSSRGYRDRVRDAFGC